MGGVWSPLLPCRGGLTTAEHRETGSIKGNVFLQYFQVHLCHAALCCAMLRCTVLCHAALCCAVPCCTVPSSSLHNLCVHNCTRALRTHRLQECRAPTERPSSHAVRAVHDVRAVQAVGVLRVIVVGVALVAGQTAWIMSDWWLARWSQASPDEQSSDMHKWLGVYGALVACAHLPLRPACVCRETSAKSTM